MSYLIVKIPAVISLIVYIVLLAPSKFFIIPGVAFYAWLSFKEKWHIDMIADLIIFVFGLFFWPMRGEIGGLFVHIEVFSLFFMGALGNSSSEPIFTEKADKVLMTISFFVFVACAIVLGVMYGFPESREYDINL